MSILRRVKNAFCSFFKGGFDDVEKSKVRKIQDMPDWFIEESNQDRYIQILARSYLLGAKKEDVIESSARHYRRMSIIYKRQLNSMKGQNKDGLG